VKREEKEEKKREKREVIGSLSPPLLRTLYKANFVT
jgi:hypothetical protein